VAAARLHRGSCDFARDDTGLALHGKVQHGPVSVRRPVSPPLRRYGLPPSRHRCAQRSGVAGSVWASRASRRRAAAAFVQAG